MKRKTFIIIGLILTGWLVISFPALHASTTSSSGSHEAETEYTGQDTPDTIQVSAVKLGAASGHQEASLGAKHEGEVNHNVHSRDTNNVHGTSANTAEAKHAVSHEPAGHQAKIGASPHTEPEHKTKKTYEKSTVRAQTDYSHAADRETGFSIGTWAVLIGAAVVMGCLIIFLIKGANSMKNLKLGTKIIGMVSIILVLMVISSGFGIIKIGDIGDEIKGIAEEDIPLTGVITEITTNQLEQAIWLERALRFGEVLAAKEAAKVGLKHAEEEFEKNTLLADKEFKQAEELAEHAAKVAKTAEARKAFEEIDHHLKEIEKQHADYEHHVHQIFALVNQGKLHEAEELAEKVEQAEEELDHELELFLTKIENSTEEATLKAEHDEQSAIRGMSIISIFSVVFGLLMGIFITRGITRPVNRVILGLNEGADQVASASGQVSSSSQSLAEGASEQAASIEETSSSLEEMSSMTQQNAQNAGQADNLMKEANKVVKRAGDSMTELTQSMDEISKAGQETSKIIKTIDEIAFQTNLLALNAAVEAARAGEAGAGFAVVADEVRNLAMRAAEAAKNTANLIEETVKKVGEGSALVSGTNEAFQKVAESASKVGELVGEIAAASTEQSQGIGQINTAVAEMDKVVQQNAANAEESASASEEMTGQAEQMKTMVAELVALVGGNGKASGRRRYASITNQKPQDQKGTVASVKKLALGNAKTVNPEALIPMEADTFQDF